MAVEIPAPRPFESTPAIARTCCRPARSHSPPPPPPPRQRYPFSLRTREPRCDFTLPRAAPLAPCRAHRASSNTPVAPASQPPACTAYSARATTSLCARASHCHASPRMERSADAHVMLSRQRRRATPHTHCSVSRLYPSEGPPPRRHRHLAPHRPPARARGLRRCSASPASHGNSSAHRTACRTPPSVERPRRRIRVAVRLILARF